MTLGHDGADQSGKETLGSERLLRGLKDRLHEVREEAGEPEELDEEVPPRSEHTGGEPRGRMPLRLRVRADHVLLLERPAESDDPHPAEVDEDPHAALPHLDPSEFSSGSFECIFL